VGELAWLDAKRPIAIGRIAPWTRKYPPTPAMAKPAVDAHVGATTATHLPFDLLAAWKRWDYQTPGILLDLDPARGAALLTGHSLLLGKPEQLHNYKNLHAKSHQTVIVPGLSLQHLEDAQHRYAEVEHELHQERERSFKPVVLDKHLSQSVKDLRVAVDTKNVRHHREAQTEEHKPVKVSFGTQSKPETKDTGSQGLNIHAITALQAGREAYQAFIKAQVAGVKSLADAREAYKQHKKQREDIAKANAKAGRVKKASKKEE
jgi:hypothetical protein